MHVVFVLAQASYQRNPGQNQQKVTSLLGSNFSSTCWSLDNWHFNFSLCSLLGDAVIRYHKLKHTNSHWWQRKFQTRCPRIGYLRTGEGTSLASPLLVSVLYWPPLAFLAAFPLPSCLHRMLPVDEVDLCSHCFLKGHHLYYIWAYFKLAWLISLMTSPSTLLLNKVTSWDAWRLDVNWGEEADVNL